MRQLSPLRCEDVWREISDYLDNNTIEPLLRKRLEAHFAECRHCTAVLEGTRNVVALIKDGKCLDLPSELRRHIYARLEQHLTSKDKP